MIREVLDFISVLGTTIGGLGCLLIALGGSLLIGIIMGERRNRP